MMNEYIEKLAYKIGEGFQASSLKNIDDQVNAFHRTITLHESSDLSFISGLVATGLRGSAFLNGEKLSTNYNQLLTASRQHLPLVVHTNARVTGKGTYSTLNNYGNISAIHKSGCFQLIATSSQEDIFLTLVAHRISELALIPGIVIADYTEVDEKADIPADNLIIKYLGSPDDHIDCPTPAQEIIFGKSRRRVPNWFSLDLPVMLGSEKDGETSSFEAAARLKYFYDHLLNLIEQAYEEFYDVFGTMIDTVSSQGKSSAYAIITIGSQVGELFAQLPSDKKNIEVISIKQLNPFPASKVSDLLAGKKAITILENINGSGTIHSTFYDDVISALNNQTTKIYSGKYSADLEVNSLAKAIQHMISDQPKRNYFLGLSFTKSSSSYPKHEILLQEISKQYPEILTDSINESGKKGDHSPAGQSEIPLAVRMYKDKGPKYTRLSRFYDNSAFFYENNEHQELIADPFAAIPVTPSASASFFSQTTKRELLPVIDVKKCPGSGESFVNCPHSALLPIVISVESLVKAGADIAGAKGITITRLTPMYKNLAKVAAKVIENTDVTTVADFLPTAFENLTSQMKLEGEKLAVAREEFNAVLAEIGFLPVAITDTFYNLPNAIDQGSGELFSLVVNPSACTGCGICADISEAITMETQNNENLATVTGLFKLWEKLPDTAGDTINRLYHDESYNSLAAMMLSRSYFMSMSGASYSENNNPYKTLVHIITATTESVVQPKILKQINNIDELIDSLSDNVHGKLSKALPKEDLANLSKTLKKAHGRKLSFQEVVNQITEHGQNKLIDTASLNRKTDLVDLLKHLKWALSEGATGVGRSRFSLLMAGANSMDWARQYPANNFTSPAIIHWHGSAPEQTLGLFYGQMRFLLDNIKLLRRADLESKDKYDPSIHDREIAGLSWDELTEDEKHLVPPILLICERGDLDEAGWSSLNKLLVEKYPVKVLLFDNMASPNHDPIADLSLTASGIFSAMALKTAFVFQGGMGNVNHLFEGLITGLDKTYPALFNLYATKPEKHGVTNVNWLPYASLALNSRAFPCLSFNPQEKDNFLNGAINLDGNKDLKEEWVTEEMHITDDEKLNYQISWADWAYTQSSWQTEFNSVSTDDANIVLPDYLLLDVKARNGKIPVIIRGQADGLHYYAVSKKVVEMSQAVLTNWQTLQELAGVVAKIPAKLKHELEEEISSKYQQEIVELKKNYEQQLQEKEAAQTEKLRQQLKEKLVALSQMASQKSKKQINHND
jgi:pyruvate/2-oxoacid:ferredoxin oxidoreductase alpha subunit/NAD-dependent dihydropyrimidine dehydrogenase PreA subunit